MSIRLLEMSTSFWGLYYEFAQRALGIILFLLIILFLIHYYSFFYIKKKLKKIVNEKKDKTKICSMIKKKYNGNFKYYILENILPKVIKRNLFKGLNEEFLFSLIKSHDGFEKIIEIFKKKVYNLLLICPISLFIFIVFLPISISKLDLLVDFVNKEKVNNIFIILKEPAFLLFLASTNVLLAVWIYCVLSVNVLDLQFSGVLTQIFNRLCVIEIPGEP